MPRDNLAIIFNERPEKDIVPGQTFKQRITPAPTAADLKDGQILVEALYCSIDPTMRTWMMNDRSYLAPLKPGSVMRSHVVSRVLASTSKLAREGDIVLDWHGWSQYAIVSDGQFESQAAYDLPAPQDALSALGLTSLTAWVGMVKIGDPKPGETVVVSGAAGATGSVAGQIAKLKGARVVGIAGSDEKCRWLTEELGFDVALNYKAPGFRKDFVKATPNYIDVYFDNVGGEILDLALGQAKEFARFVECGHISQYNAGREAKGPRNISRVVTMRIAMTGFIVLDHHKDFPRARKELSGWLAEGKIKKTETIVKGGLQKAEQALIDMYKGINTGKLLVEVKDPNETPAKL